MLYAKRKKISGQFLNIVRSRALDSRRVFTAFLAVIFIFMPILEVAAQEASSSVERDLPFDLPAEPASVSLEAPVVGSGSGFEPLELPEMESAALEALAESEQSGSLEMQTDKGTQDESLEGLEGGEMQSMSTGGDAAGDTAIKLGAPFANGARVRPTVDRQSGAMTYQYPLQVPEGRLGLTPEVVLSYSSHIQNGDMGLLGRGWTISVPKIERMTRHGVNNLYNGSIKFQSSLSGDLSYMSTGYYGARIETGDFVRYELTNNVWIAKTKDGLTYTYGTTTAERMDDPNNASKIFAWYLSSIEDANGNSIRYDYHKSQGQVYPSRIVYTNAGGQDGIFSVDFIRENRPDTIVSFRSAFGVTTTQRIARIDVKTQDQVRRRYQFAYETGDNGVAQLLDSVTEIGFDQAGVSSTLPATTFEYRNHSTGWVTNTDSSKWQYPTLDSYHNRGRGVIYADVNGDGLTDIVTSRPHFTSPTNWYYVYKTYINNGYTWVENSTWALPMALLVWNGSNHVDGGVRLTDVTGDGLLDVVSFGPQKWSGDTSGSGATYWQYVFRNTGSGWTRDTNYSSPLLLVNTTYADTGARIVDVNGDGLSDALGSSGSAEGTGAPQGLTSRINLGYTWDNSTLDWNYPAPIHPYFSPINQSNWAVKPNMFFIDLNGDGLQDILWEAVYHTTMGTGALHVTANYKRAYLNTGKGWRRDDSYAAPVMLTTSGYFDSTEPDGIQRWLSKGGALGDINGDGLTDILHTKITWVAGDATMTTTTVNTVHLNTGHGWLSSTTTLPVNLVVTAGNLINGGCCVNTKVDDGARTADFDGDGVMDIVDQMSAKMHLGSYGVADVMTQVTTPYGAVTDVEYLPAGWHITGTSTRMNPLMPSAQIQTVASLETTDGETSISRKTYSYEGGWNFYVEGGTGGYSIDIPRSDRTFAGYDKVTESDGMTSTTIFYHTGNGTNSSQGEYQDQYAKIGMPYREEVRGMNGALYSVKMSKWDKSNIPINILECCRQAYRVWSPHTVTLTYDGGASYRGTAVKRTYDSKGNLTQLLDYGEASVNTDGTYTESGTDWRQTDYEYATGPTGISSFPKRIADIGTGGGWRVTNLIYDGAATGTVVNGNLTRKTVTDGDVTIGVTNTWTYDSTGVPLSMVDGRGYTTTYTYDAHKLKAATTTNALSQTKAVTWDYANGVPTRIKEVSGAVQRATYDAFGRLKNVYGPDAGGQETLLAQHDYVDTPGSLSVTRTEEVDGVNEVASRTHYDALGREIQTRRTWPDSSVVVKDTAYNLQGLTDWTSLPYASSGLNKTGPTSDADLKISHLYDPMGRVATTTDALGISSNVYDRWVTKSKDRLGREKSFERDAYGRLVKLTERLSSTDYHTSYEYTWAGDLKKITDAAGNVRNFTYDLLGRRLTAQDLHHASDVTYGTEQYGYDGNNNVVSRTRPGGVSLAYVYDALNRLTQVTASGTIAEQYSYDSCTNGTGRLCSETSPDHLRLFEYDMPGRVASSTLLIDDRAYPQQNRYTLNGLLSGYTAPDGQNVGYTFDTDKVASVASKEFGGSTSTLVSAIGYHPSGLVSSITYGNGAVTTNNYDVDHLYRLSQKTTTVNAANVQNISYTYDAMGNITALTESAGPASRVMSYAYDDLDRLTSATGTTASGTLIYAEHFGYDILGNILNKLSVSPTSTHASTYSYEVNGGAYANPHAVTSIALQQGTSTISTTLFTYDWRGNPVSSAEQDASEQVIPGTERAYTWDAKDRMVGLVLGSGSSSQSLEYVYSNSDERLKMGETGATSTIYASKAYNETLTASGTVVDVQKHIFNGRTLLATIDGTGGSARALFDHTDHLSGASVVTADGGSVEETFDYHPYGSIRIDEKSGDWSQQRKYAGHEFDDASGLSFMEARYYNPETGRFLNIDPAFRDLSFRLEDPQSLNSYAYARNNPLKYVDLDGREPVSVIVGAAFFWTAAASLAVQVPLWMGGTDAALRGDDPASQQLFNSQQAVGWGTLAAFEIQAPALAIPAGGYGVNKLKSDDKSVTASTFPQAGQHSRSYSSFNAFKRGEGKAGPGMEWHHIVEQNPANKAKFSPYQLQNTQNIVAIPREQHRQVSGMYSSNIRGSGSPTVRSEVSQMSFQQQYNYGMRVLSEIMNKARDLSKISK